MGQHEGSLQEGKARAEHRQGQGKAQGRIGGAVSPVIIGTVQEGRARAGQSTRGELSPLSLQELFRKAEQSIGVGMVSFVSKALPAYHGQINGGRGRVVTLTVTLQSTPHNICSYHYCIAFVACT